MATSKADSMAVHWVVLTDGSLVMKMALWMVDWMDQMKGVLWVGTMVNHWGEK